MSFNLIRSPPFNQRRSLRLIQFRKLESYHPDGPIFRTPVVGAAPRPAQGLDMNKISLYPYQPFWKTREKFNDDYKYGHRNAQPSGNAMTPEEMVTYYDNTFYLEKFTWSELMRLSSLRYFRAWIYFATYPLVGLIGLGIYFIPSNRYEAIEYFMPVDEYYENYVWHDFGKFIDKTAYTQYLEARRGKKWGRNPHVDPVDYIPAKYRSERQRIERGEIAAPSSKEEGEEFDGAEELEETGESEETEELED